MVISVAYYDRRGRRKQNGRRFPAGRPLYRCVVSQRDPKDTRAVMPNSRGWVDVIAK